LARFSTNAKEFSYFTFKGKKGLALDEVKITALFKDKNGMIWVGTVSGLFNFNSLSGLFEESLFEVDSEAKFSFENIFISTINEDKSGNLLVGNEGRVL